METKLTDEPRVYFKAISDRSCWAIGNKENVRLLEISGYDLDVHINLEPINSVEDVEGLIDGIGDLFREIIMEQLIAKDSKQ